MSDCTDCILDLTDACPRGSGRAIDDEICDSFFPRETYEVNKNDSWQLGYKQGRADKYQEITSEYMLLTEKQADEIRADAIDEFVEWLYKRRDISYHEKQYIRDWFEAEQLKEKKNE